ncbi:MAG: hypothetical protein INH41_03290 [Myxococcaceae bacterium]|jgi:hypothetical protein|nr:hypothetical protein [Myxococcaceae bacterium]
MPRQARAATTAKNPQAARAHLISLVGETEVLFGLLACRSAAERAAGSEAHVWRSLIQAMGKVPFAALTRAFDDIPALEGTQRALRQLSLEVVPNTPDVEELRLDLRVWLAQGELLRNSLGLIDLALPPLEGHEALETQACAWAVRAAAEWARKQNSKERASLMAHLLVAADVESVAENADWTELLWRCQKTLRRNHGNALDALFRKAPKQHQQRFIASTQKMARAHVEHLLARLQSGEPMTSLSADDRALLERIAAAVETMDNEAEVSRRRPRNRAR